MDSLMKYISRIHRSSNSYRVGQIEVEGLRGHQHIYIFHVCRRAGITQDKLAELISVNKSNVTRQLSILESEGFIRKQVNADDKRLLEVYPTQKALDLYPLLDESMKEWSRLLLEELSFEEKETLTNLLQKVAIKATLLVERED